MTTYTCSDQTDLNTAIGAAVAGDVIELHEGATYNLVMDTKVYASDVTIRSVSGEQATITGPDTTSYIVSCAHVVLDNLILYNPVSYDGGSPPKALSITDCTNVKVTNCIICGWNYPLTPTSWNDVYYGARGLKFSAVTDGEVSDCEFRNLGAGAEFFGLDTVQILRNTFHWIRYAGCMAGSWTDVTFKDNRIVSLLPWGPSQGGTDHPDTMILFNAGPGETDTNVLIEGNLLASGDSYLLVQDETDVATGCFINITIRNNFIWSAAYLGADLSGFNGATITKNTMLVPVNLKANERGRLVYSGGPNNHVGSNVSITNNIGGDFTGGNTNSGNDTSQDACYVLSDYFTGDHFCCGVGFEGMDWEELAPIPSSALQIPGKGCWEYLSAAGKDPKVYVAATFHHGTRDSLTVDFSVGDYDGGDGIPGGGYTASWNFGDGSTGSGTSVSHAYAAGGVYLVTMTVLDGATTYVMRRAVKLISPLLFWTRFENNLTQEGFVGPNGTWGTPTYVAGNGGGYAADIVAANTGPIFSQPADISGWPDITVAFDWKATGSPTGRPFAFTQYFITIDPPTTFLWRLWTILGGQNILYADVGSGINDGAWHRMLCVYSDTDGLTRFYWDGSLISSQASTGGTWQSADDLTLGGTGGEHCAFTIDNLAIYAASMTPAEEVGLREAWLAGGSPLPPIVPYSARRLRGRRRRVF